MGVRIAAIILSAGYSSRMGEFKPLLPLGDTTVIERVVTLFHDEGIGDIRVVAGHRRDELLPLVRRLDAVPIPNERFQDGMFTSVVAGVESLEADIDAFFLLPVDIPLVRRYTVRTLIDAYAGYAPRILYPCFCGRRGHPPLIPTSHRCGILDWHGEGGLKTCLARFEAQSACVDVADETILADMDTPEDYLRLQAKWERRDIPTVSECEALLRIVASCDDRLLAHGRAVSRLSCFLGDKLVLAGGAIDRDKLVAAALLHDIAKGRKSHAAEGANILRTMGYPGVADIVASHMDISVDENGPVGEREVLYLADKMTSGDRLVSVEDRFSARLETSAADISLRRVVERRLGIALMIRKRIEILLGRSLGEIMKDFAA